MATGVHTFHFVLVTEGADLLDWKTLDALYEAGCGDATVGHDTLEFDRTAPTRDEALYSAMRDAESVPGVRVLRIELCTGYGPIVSTSRWEDIKRERGEPSDEARAGVEQDLAIGQLIYDLRIEVGLSQRELAERMGTTQSVISRLEEGGGARNRIDTLARYVGPGRDGAGPSPRALVPRRGTRPPRGRHPGCVGGRHGRGSPKGMR